MRTTRPDPSGTGARRPVIPRWADEPSKDGTRRTLCLAIVGVALWVGCAAPDELGVSSSALSSELQVVALDPPTLLTGGGYLIEVEGRDAAFTIVGDDVDTRVWGDPHVQSGSGSDQHFDFGSRTTHLVLADGTKIAMHCPGRRAPRVSTLVVDDGASSWTVRGVDTERPTVEATTLEEPTTPSPSTVVPCPPRAHRLPLELRGWCRPDGERISGSLDGYLSPEHADHGL